MTVLSFPGSFGSLLHTLKVFCTTKAMLPAPNGFAVGLCNPSSKVHKALKDARDRVISRMAEQGKISAQVAVNARRIPIQASTQFCKNFEVVQRAPYYTDYTLYDEFPQRLGATADEGNFIIETTLDWPMQQVAEQVLKQALADYGVPERFDQGAILTLDARTGSILAMVGGSGYVPRGFNRALQAERQPGSTFKLFAYLAALEKGLSPDKTYSCASIHLAEQDYEPCQRSTEAEITMTQALARSENPVALRVAEDVGLPTVIDTAKRLGITTALQATPGMVLGQDVAKLVEMTKAYAIIANGGRDLRVHTLAQIRDSNRCKNNKDSKTCTIVFTNSEKAEQNKQLVDPQVAATLTQMLQAVVNEGTGKKAFLDGVMVAGKTGTTNDYRDLWFIGYFPQQQFVTGVWLGNENNSPTRSQSSRAAQIWASYMARLIRR